MPFFKIQIPEKGISFSPITPLSQRFAASQYENYITVHEYVFMGVLG